MRDIYCRWCNKQTIIGTLRRQFVGGVCELCGLQHNLALRVKQKGQRRTISELTPTNNKPTPVHLPPQPPHSNSTKMQIVPYVCWNVEEGVVEWMVGGGGLRWRILQSVSFFQFCNTTNKRE